MSTIRQALLRTQGVLSEAGIPESRLEAELLLCHLTGLSRSHLHAYPEHILMPEQEASLSSALARRLRREPLDYILGYREFYGLKFAVRPGVLIPRPETELLVERALDLVRGTAHPERFLVADVATGCGNIAVALAVNAPGLRVIATDTSPAALEVARENVARHHVQDRVDLRQGDLLAPLDCRVDIIVANLPYVRSERMAMLQPEVAWEPVEALDGGPDGLDTIRRLLRQAPQWLKRGGYLLLEMDPEQREPLVLEAAKRFMSARTDVLRDMAGLDRVLVVGPK